jgi:hypothetical protein
MVSGFDRDKSALALVGSPPNPLIIVSSLFFECKFLPDAVFVFALLLGLESGLFLMLFYLLMHFRWIILHLAFQLALRSVEGY